MDPNYASRDFGTDSAIAAARGVSVGDKELTPWDAPDDVSEGLSLETATAVSFHA